MFDRYKHLSNDARDGVAIGVEAIAEQVVRLNYGFHRMLCALVRFHLARFPNSELAREVKAVLDRGFTT
jgi:hypothetical protein